MAVVMALLLKGFIVEAYKIPTGSMQPTLIGDEESGLKDRILVDKLTYALREPERWEVAVFRYPLNAAQNFVKRVVGIGPEQLRIKSGDLWRRDDGSQPWRIMRRPDHVQREAWKELDLEAPGGTSWSVVAGGSDWELAGRSIGARGAGRAGFRPSHGSITDRYLDGYPEAIVPWLEEHDDSGLHPVGDLRLEGVVTALPGTRSVVLDLEEGPRRYRFRVPGPAAPEAARASIAVQPTGRWRPSGASEASAADARRLVAGVPTRFAVENLDDRVALLLGGEEVAALEVEEATDQTSRVFVSLEGEGADFDELMVYRDIYYLSEGRWLVTIPAGHYYMLGDNTQDSSDSREWSYQRLRVPADGMLTDGSSTRVIRGNSRRNENPRTLGYGEPGGPRLTFVDEFGETHWYAADAVDLLESEAAPFVPQEMILGRALAVFWPIAPFRDIVRLKWVR
jgi:signal peptidase I